MKVLKTGEIIKQITCNKCSSELQYNEWTDVEIYEDRVTAYDTEFRKYVRCPICGNIIYL